MQSQSDYVFHQYADKQGVYISHSEIWWSAELKKWMCTNAAYIEKILSDKNFQVHSYSMKALEDRLGISLPHIAGITEHFALAKEGAEHKALRKQNALNLAQNFEKTLVKFKESLLTNIATILPIQHNVNWVKSVIDPSLRSALITLSGLEDLDEKNIISITQIFDQSLSIKSRVKIDAQIATLLNSFKADLTMDEKYFKIAAFSIGYDSLLGSVTESFGRTLLQNANSKLSEINWGVNLPYSGVPVIERVAIRDCIIGEKIIKQGESVRLYIESAGFNDKYSSSHAALFFGHGIHKCIAMHLSNAVWKMFIEVISNIDKRFLIKKLTYRQDDRIFNVFDDITMDIYD